jgi:hypothetical protein
LRVLIILSHPMHSFSHVDAPKTNIWRSATLWVASHWSYMNNYDCQCLHQKNRSRSTDAHLPTQPHPTLLVPILSWHGQTLGVPSLPFSSWIERILRRYGEG